MILEIRDYWKTCGNMSCEGWHIIVLDGKTIIHESKEQYFRASRIGSSFGEVLDRLKKIYPIKTILNSSNYKWFIPEVLEPTANKR